MLVRAKPALQTPSLLLDVLKTEDEFLASDRIRSTPCGRSESHADLVRVERLVAVLLDVCRVLQGRNLDQSLLDRLWAECTRVVTPNGDSGGELSLCGCHRRSSANLASDSVAGEVLGRLSAACRRLLPTCRRACGSGDSDRSRQERAASHRRCQIARTCLLSLLLSVLLRLWLYGFGI